MEKFNTNSKEKDDVQKGSFINAHIYSIIQGFYLFFFIICRTQTRKAKTGGTEEIKVGAGK